MKAPTGHTTPVCVVGTGACTAVGQSARSSGAAIRGGVAGFAEHPYMVDRDGEPMIVARVSQIESGASVLGRMLFLAKRAANEAVAPLRVRNIQTNSLRVFIGLPAQRPGRPRDLEERTTIFLQRDLGFSSPQCIATGHAAGLMALEVAVRQVITGSSEFCVIGGVDSYLDADTLEWLDENERLHGDSNPFGFIPGEAAGFCVICSERMVERFRLDVLARVMTVAVAKETKLIKSRAVCIGQGLTEAFVKALAALPSESDKIDSTICDMNGEAYRTDEYGFAIARISERFVNASDFVAPADCWGDVGAASGPLFVNLAVESCQRGYAKGPRNLIWASSEGGDRGAAVVALESY